MFLFVFYIDFCLDDLSLLTLFRYDYLPELIIPKTYTNYNDNCACYNFIANVKLTSDNRLKLTVLIFFEIALSKILIAK